MIVDFHTHVSPPSMRQDRTPFLVPEETAFTAIYANPKAKLAGASELVGVMDEEGVDRAVIFGFPWKNRDIAKMHNDYVIEAQARFPGRLVGLACFDPLASWAEAEAIRTLDAGLAGLGELAIYDSGFDGTAITRLAALGAICRERNALLLVHVNEPVGHLYPGKAPLTLKMIYDLVLAVPGVKLVLAHWGGGLLFFNLLKKEAPEALADVYYDTAASPFLYQPRIYDLALRAVGPEKILMGTDFPLLRPGRYFKEMEQAGLSPDQTRWIQGQAAENLLASLG